MMTTYVGLDAGVVSGVAVLEHGKMVPEFHELGDHETIGLMARLMQKGTPTVIFYEKFVISQRTLKTTIQYQTLNINGWVHYEGARLKYITTKGYTAAQSKAFSTDDKLKKMEWWHPSKDGHGNDAARVLLLGLSVLRNPWVLSELVA